MSIQHIIDFAQATTAAEHYQTAADKMIAGQGAQSVRNHYSSPCGQFAAGVWEGSTPGIWHIHYTEHEYCEILSGVAIIRDEEGNAKTLRAGDRFVIPAGFRGTWEVVEPCRKIYAVFEAKN